MGAQIRGFDWGATPLGPPDRWPVPLRTAIRILLTTNHPVFIFWGADHRCFYNDAYSASLGAEKHPSILGATGREAWPEIWSIIGPQIDYVMTGQGATWHENQLVPIQRHGRRDDVYWTYGYSPIDDEDATRGVGGVLVLCTETTEQVLAADRTRAAEARWRSLFDQAPGFMGLLDGPDHVLEFANPRYFDLFGHADMLGLPVAKALPWAIDQGFITLLDQVYASGDAHVAQGAPVAVPARHEGTTGVLYVDFVLQPIRDPNGAVTGIFVLGSDVTQRQRAELTIAESEQRLRIARDAAQLGIYDFNFANQRFEWDERVRELWGVDATEVITLELLESAIHPEDRSARQAAVVSALDPGGEGRYFAEYRVTNRIHGVTRWVQAHGRVSFLNDQPVRLTGAIQDVSEYKDAEARKNEFLATLSHELRNPLAPIRNAVELLKSRQLAPDIARQAQAVIERQTEQMVRLIDDLMDVARISRGRLTLRKERIDLDTAIQLAREVAISSIERGEHQLSITSPPERVYLQADPVRLAQVLGNLLINAAKYSEARRRIELIISPPKSERVEIVVRDQGIGIAAENLERVFEMFTQANGSQVRSQGGLGIGLALARALIELHGGTLSAQSAGAGQGSEFVISLPVGEMPAAGTVPDRKHEDASALLRGRAILIVDDNVDAASMLAMLLETEGAQVVVAHDGPGALRVADTVHPEVVLLDIGLPGMGGHEVCRRLRLQPWATNVLILAQTGWGQEADRERSRLAGFDAHLVKPIEPDELLRTLADLLA
ncbi:MAG: ATP-binding protein [Gammaproteobacteria bacterium]